MTGVLFYLPNARQLSISGAILPGWKAQFLLTETDTPTPVYADGDLSTELDNPVEALGTGEMPPIYMDPAIVYRVQLFTAADVLIEDIDPFDVSRGGGSGATALSDLTDVSIPDPLEGQLLSFDGDKWVAIFDIGAAANITPDTHPASPNAQDDEFENGSSIDLGKWTAFGTTQGNSLQQGSLVLLSKLTASRNMAGYVQPISGSWSYTCKISVFNGTANTLIGMLVSGSAGTAGPLICFGLNASAQTAIVQRLSNNTTFSANQSITVGFPNTGPTKQTFPYYLRITYDGTTLRFLINAWGGVDSAFVEVWSETSAAFLGAPSFMGLGGDNESATEQSIGIFDWFRKTA